jgi:hypothetical protein
MGNKASSQGAAQPTYPTTRNTSKYYKYSRISAIRALTPQQISSLAVDDIDPNIKASFSAQPLNPAQDSALTSKLRERRFAGGKRKPKTKKTMKCRKNYKK